MIIDTDLSLYWDDVTALGMANVLQQRGKVEILGVMSDIRNTEAVAAIDAIDTAYGHSRIPVGAVADSEADTVPTGYSDVLAAGFPTPSAAAMTLPVPFPLPSLAGEPNPTTASPSWLSAPIPTWPACCDRGRAGKSRSRSGPDRGQGTQAGDRGRPVPGRCCPGRSPTRKYDVASARAVVGGAGWPTPIAWVDGYTGINTKVGGELCSTTPPTIRCASCTRPYSDADRPRTATGTGPRCCMPSAVVRVFSPSSGPGWRRRHERPGWFVVADQF